VLDSGIKSIAVVFKHAAIFPDHEEAVGSVARELGFQQVRNCSNKAPTMHIVKHFIMQLAFINAMMGDSD